MQIGTADADSGELDHGFLPVTDLPAGGTERIPVTVANGREDGPTVWVTAAIHGDEVTAFAAARDLPARLDPTELSGAVVVVPTLNPAGVRRGVRTSYYHDDDPNRYYPDAGSENYRPPRVQELVDERVFEAFTETAPADALLDLHTAGVGSVPFAIRDRVLYGERRDESAARDLADELDSLANAVGLPVVNEYAAEEYTGESLQRSTAGAALNEAGIPALTLELGSPDVVDDDMTALGVAACFRALDALDATARSDDLAAPVESPVDFPVKRRVGPHADTAGLAAHHLRAGDSFEADDAIAAVTDPHGREQGTLTADSDGYVLGRRGLAVYENDPLYSLAVRDDGDLVVPRDE